MFSKVKYRWLDSMPTILVGSLPLLKLDCFNSGSCTLNWIPERIVDEPATISVVIIGMSMGVSVAPDLVICSNE